MYSKNAYVQNYSNRYTKKKVTSDTSLNKFQSKVFKCTLEGPE